MDVRKQLALPAGQAWMEAGGVCKGLTTIRAKDVVNVAYAALIKAGVSVEQIQHYTVDTSQCVKRKTWGEKVRNLTTSSCLFSFGKDRVLCPDEHYNVLGLEGVKLDGLSERQSKELAGQAMAAPCIALPLLCLIASLPNIWARAT